MPDDVTAFSTPAEIDEFLRVNYPDVAPFAEASEQIKWILYDAAVNERDPLEIQSAIRRTDYWKSHGPASRAFDLLLGTDGKRAEELIDRASSIVDDLFARNGIQLDDATRGELAKQAIRAGDITLEGDVRHPDGLNALVAFGLGQSTGDLPTGETSFNADQFRTLASSEYLLPITHREANEWAVRSLNGQASEESFRAEMSRRSAERYPWLAQHISAGSTPRSATDGVTAVIADTLELDPDSVNLMDAKYKGVLEFFDDKAKQYRGMTLGEAATWARQQDAFKGTQQYIQGDAAFSKGLIDFVEGRR